MWITHSYLGISRGRMRCLFFLLYQDYIEAETQFAKDLDLELERFARNLEDAGAVVRPFRGDIEKTKSHIQDKNWTKDERDELMKTPALLMINVDFDNFDPREHPWFLLSFGKKVGVSQSYEALKELAEAVKLADSDVFEAAHKIMHEIHLSDATKVFEAKPGIFGFSVDLLKGAQFLKALYRRFVRR